MQYDEFLSRKTQLDGEHGFAPTFMPEFLFPFQRSLVEWSTRKGRAAVFADCGLGKTPMELVWSENVVRATGKPVLLLTPLAVAPQVVEEGAKFGIEVHAARCGAVRPGCANVANYERLHYFNPDDFGGIACDESSILKSFDGATRSAVTAFARKLPYRFLGTATAAPNDYIELGTSSEALGQLGHMDMLGRFFKNDQNNGSMNRGWRGQSGCQTQGRSTWRFKGHAEASFWRWVCSWARAVRKPSDLGFDDGRFRLPELVEHEHIVSANRLADGMLFELPAVGLREEREENRRTLTERCEMAAGLAAGTDPVVVWCHLNDEGRLLARLIQGAVEVSGADTDDEKEEKFAAFKSGQARVLVCKPKIGAWGLNWQHCARIVYFPSHSYESYYQAVRRCWRFGQTRDVHVDIVTTRGGHEVMESLRRKSSQADSMFSRLVAQMNNALAVQRSVTAQNAQEVPSWLSSIRS